MVNAPKDSCILQDKILPNFLITLIEFELANVSFSAMENLKTACEHIDC